MSTFKERLNTALTRWIESGKSSTELFATEYERMRVYLWVFSPGAKKEEVGEDLIEFGRANRQAIGNENYDRMLRKREYCSLCGETYKLENLSICVNCDNLFCYRCTGQYGTASNGNRRCSCGEELVG